MVSLSEAEDSEWEEILTLGLLRAADPAVGNQILQKRKEYQQAAVTRKIIGL